MRNALPRPVRRRPRVVHFFLCCGLALSAACAPTPEVVPDAAPDTAAAEPEQRTAAGSDAGPAPPEAEVSELRRVAQRMGTSGLVAPRQISTELPEYTSTATEAGVQGDVYIEAVVTVEGNVAEPRLIRGLPDDELNRRALDSITRWKFEPGTKDNQPVPVIALFTVTFRLH